MPSRGLPRGDYVAKFLDHLDWKVSTRYRRRPHVTARGSSSRSSRRCFGAASPAGKVRCGLHALSARRLLYLGAALGVLPLPRSTVRDAAASTGRTACSWRRRRLGVSSAGLLLSAPLHGRGLRLPAAELEMAATAGSACVFAEISVVEAGGVAGAGLAGGLLSWEGDGREWSRRCSSPGRALLGLSNI